MPTSMASPRLGWCHQSPHGNGLEHMKRFLLTLGLWLGLTSGALAQNPQCPTRPLGDSSNACSSTAFVQNQFAAQAPIPGFITCGANQFVNSVAATSVCAQPSFSNLSGRATLAQLPQGIANSIWINPTGDRKSV